MHSQHTMFSSTSQAGRLADPRHPAVHRLRRGVRLVHGAARQRPGNDAHDLGRRRCECQDLAPAAADQQRPVLGLDRARQRFGHVDLDVVARVRARRLREAALDDRHRLAQPLDTHPAGRELQAELTVVGTELYATHKDATNLLSERQHDNTCERSREKNCKQVRAQMKRTAFQVNAGEVAAGGFEPPTTRL